MIYGKINGKYLPIGNLEDILRKSKPAELEFAELDWLPCFEFQSISRVNRELDEN